ncbi:MAG TPA: hypothetical protein VJX67_08175, partial [Blastocatellia bacterium]|nr:hypothetical protein [Blastocatellia bacterium]
MKLSPDVDWITQLLSATFLSSNSLTTYAHALLNTVPFPLDPQPSWFPQLNTDLQSARAAAQQWVDTDGPNVAAGLTQAWIDYANLFISAEPTLSNLAAQIEGNPGRTPTNAERQELLTLLGALTQMTGQVRATVT